MHILSLREVDFAGIVLVGLIAGYVMAIAGLDGSSFNTCSTTLPRTRSRCTTGTLLYITLVARVVITPGIAEYRNRKRKPGY